MTETNENLGRVIREEPIHEGRVFDLVRQQVDLPNGRRAQLDLIRHPGAAAMVPVDEDGNLLLLRQYRHAAGGYIWEIPAGTLDPGESPLQCAGRELVEETGFSAKTWKKLVSMTPVPGYSTEVIHLFLATDLSPAKQKLDPDEVLEVRPVAYGHALDMVADGAITDAKTICGVLMARPHLFTSP